jgi:hypothetical protein
LRRLSVTTVIVAMSNETGIGMARMPREKPTAQNDPKLIPNAESARTSKVTLMPISGEIPRALARLMEMRSSEKANSR